MKKLLIILIVLILCGTPGVAQTWVNAVDNARAMIQIEKTLYEKKDHPNFFIHVRIVNRTSKVLGVDLRDQWHTIYPNQWTSSDLDHRTVIDEEVMVPKKLDVEFSQALKEAYRSKTLTYIRPSETMTYYTNSNAVVART